MKSKAEKLSELFRETQNIIIICSNDDIEDFKKGAVKCFTEGEEEYWREDTKEDEGVNSLSILAKRRTFLLIDEKDQFNFYNIMIDSIK